MYFDDIPFHSHHLLSQFSCYNNFHLYLYNVSLDFAYERKHVTFDFWVQLDFLIMMFTRCFPYEDTKFPLSLVQNVVYLCWLYGKSAGLHYVSNVIFVNFNGIFIVDISINVVIVQHIHITMSYKLILLTPQESVFILVTFCFSYFHFPPFIFFIKKSYHFCCLQTLINC